MADTGESSSSNSVNSKPVIVRVKRKASLSPLEAFWLEINERPLKRPMLDFEKLSISEEDSNGKKEKLKTKKVFVQHVETVSSSKATIDVLQSFVPTIDDASDFKTKVEERRQTFKQENKQDQLLSRAREKHEVLAKHARFEQIWKRRKGKKETMHDDSIHELCHLYDVVRVDVEEEKPKKVEQPEDTSLEDSEILCNYLPLIREFLPDVAAEIQSDIQSYLSNQASTDGYVYDLYTVQNELNTTDEDTLNTYPLVQVGDDDDFYDGPIESEWESDSNAEDNPMNEYPDEETSEEDSEEDESKTSNDESEELESRSSSSHLDGEHESRVSHIQSEDEYSFDEEEEMLADDEDEDVEDNWRWEHR
ncbi:hypothetical protein BVC80_1555g4 [Macleaya cordata]|uniref:Transcription factor Iwr1 domain-containing protein n=1 Tax=Macleaya cordata TaxID=56857 RepID=A0A200QY12_MACCD|nr:hypothetical protein BVC80_1555g4 [Macleaya cordata]